MVVSFRRSMAGTMAAEMSTIEGRSGTASSQAGTHMSFARDGLSTDVNTRSEYHNGSRVAAIELPDIAMTPPSVSSEKGQTSPSYKV